MTLGDLVESSDDLVGYLVSWLWTVGLHLVSWGVRSRCSWMENENVVVDDGGERACLVVEDPEDHFAEDEA